MRALQFDHFAGPLTVREVLEPVPGDGEAVVAVEATGLCRSDWHAWMGHDDDVRQFPHTPGHEFAGTVRSVGAGVSREWVGRRVTAPFVFACGQCQTCRAGDGQVCPHQQQPGFSLPGSFAEQVVVTAAETNLVPLPEGLSTQLAAGLGCRVATAYRALLGRGRVEAGQWVAVFGCGGVGLSSIAIAASRGARVVAVDVSDGSLLRARQVGAERVVNSSTVDAVEAVRQLTGGGARVAVDAFGSAQTCTASILSLGRRGRHVQIGLLPEPVLMPMGRVIAWELDVLGSHGMAAAAYPALLADVAAGRLDLAGLASAEPVLTLDDAAQELPAMSNASSTGLRVIDPTR